ncbi:hypothetical protein B296_00055297 [Ensete ventricosum]|uniref:Uncharacterized protein n=1 Tax=Ensete ventricosum TaxID=4639 RepID=A0A426XIU0_ENSVE|nr:hypothetical protein B296_00055297 [Ensete ventricosum]
MFLFPAWGDVSSPRAVIEIARKQWIRRTTLDSKYFSPCGCIKGHPRGSSRGDTPFSFQFQKESTQPQAASPPQAGTTLPIERQPPTIWFVDDMPSFLLESDQALFGDVARCPTPTPSASVHSLSDPDTLSSDSSDSLRVQLCQVNQRMDDIHKTIRTKDVRGESPLCGSPFIQEIQDTLISQHFHLPMLEVLTTLKYRPSMGDTNHPIDEQTKRIDGSDLSRGLAANWFAPLIRCLRGVRAAR